MYCGNDIPEGSSFCPSCGNSVVVPGAPMANPDQNAPGQSYQTQPQPQMQYQLQWQNQNPYQPAEVNDSSVMKVFSGIMCVVFLAFFLTNFFPPIINTVLSFLYGGYGILYTITSLLLGASFGIMAVVMFVIFWPGSTYCRAYNS